MTATQPTRQPQPRIVSPHGDTPYATIAEALRDADLGTRIEVRPGIYTDPLVIDTLVEIVGVGPTEDVIVRVADSVGVSSRAGGVVLRSLTIETTELDRPTGCAAVDVCAGALQLEDCWIGSETGDGVDVHGEGAAVTVARCRIRDTAGSALSARQRGKAALTECVIERAFDGVTIRQGGVVHIKHCTIHDCTNAGLSFVEYGSGTVEDSEVAWIRAMGIGVMQGSDPVIRRCTVRDGSRNGIGVLDHGLPVIEDCEISGHGMEGIIIAHGGAPVLRRCVIRGSAHFGVGVYEQGLGLLEDCEITGHMYGGVKVEDAWSAPTLRHCQIHDNDNFGVSSDKEASGLFEDCTISTTKGPGAYIAGKATPIIRDCTITDGRSEGAVVTKRAGGMVEGCTISDNAGVGILIEEKSDPTVRGCRIYGSEDAGVWVDANGRGTIEDCDIYDNAEPGVRISRGGDPILRRCQVHDGWGGGIVRADGGLGTLEGCTEANNAPVATPQEAEAVLARQREREGADSAREEVVFCTRHGDEDDPRALYDGFDTEDDVRLYALAHAVEAGTMSDRDASAAWEEIYGEDLLGEDGEGEPRFPSSDYIMQMDMEPGRRAFCVEADSLEIPGVGTVTSGLSPASGLVFHVVGTTALKRLRAALRGHYKIVVWPDYSYLEARNLEQANRMIKAARERDEATLEDNM